MVRVEAGDHRRRRGARPRRGADRLVEADAARGELVDRRRAHDGERRSSRRGRCAARRRRRRRGSSACGSAACGEAAPAHLVARYRRGRAERRARSARCRAGARRACRAPTTPAPAAISSPSCAWFASSGPVSFSNVWMPSSPPIVPTERQSRSPKMTIRSGATPFDLGVELLGPVDARRRADRRARRGSPPGARRGRRARARSPPAQRPLAARAPRR